jgi:hypothetical protein
LCLTGLHAFEHEGIQNITLLKDQLVTASHDQTPAILKRHADVIARYDTGFLFITCFISLYRLIPVMNLDIFLNFFVVHNLLPVVKYTWQNS